MNVRYTLGQIWMFLIIDEHIHILLYFVGFFWRALLIMCEACILGLIILLVRTCVCVSEYSYGNFILQTTSNN